MFNILFPALQHTLDIVNKQLHMTEVSNLTMESSGEDEVLS